jgi:hypothetical protein
VETLFVLRTTGPQDIKAIEGWVKYHQVDDTLLKSLAGLEDGEAWVWSPHYLKACKRIHFRRRSTFDSGATPKNLRGKDAKRVATLTDVDLTALRTSINATMERAKADDPKALRARIVDLERQLATTTKVAEPKPKVIEVPAVKEADIRRLETAVERLQKTGIAAVETARDVLAALPRQGAQAPAAKAVSVGRSVEAVVPRPPTPRPKPATTSTDGAVPSIGKGERTVLIAIVQLDGATREQLTITTGYKKSSRDTYVHRLRQAGLVEVNGGEVRATEQGLAELGDDYKPLPRGAGLREHWRNVLPEGEVKVFNVIVEAYPDAVSRDEISNAVDYKKSSRDTYIHRLRGRKLVETSAAGVRASAHLFTEDA